MKALAAQVNIPDGFFYYGLSIGLAGVLVWLLIRYHNKIDKTFERIADTLAALKEQQTIHEVKIGNHDKDIEHLKAKI